MTGHPSKALWRIEFRTNLTRADAPLLRLGYLLESRWPKKAHWPGDIRWLGLLFRKKLTVSELDKVNAATWPELKNLEPFMKGLFEQAWAKPVEALVMPAQGLGSARLAATYEQHSALHFATETGGPNLEEYKDDPVRSFSDLYGYLLGRRDDLKPTLVAPVVPFRRRAASVAPTADLELMNQAA